MENIFNEQTAYDVASMLCHSFVDEQPERFRIYKSSKGAAYTSAGSSEGSLLFFSTKLEAQMTFNLFKSKGYGCFMVTLDEDDGVTLDEDDWAVAVDKNMDWFDQFRD